MFLYSFVALKLQIYYIIIIKNVNIIELAAKKIKTRTTTTIYINVYCFDISILYN